MTISVLVDAVTGAPVWTGRNTRGMFSSLFGGKTAARPLGCRSGVAANTPTSTITVAGTTWTIKPHAGAVDLETAAAASVYPYVNDADVTGSHDAAHATLPRIDLLCFHLDDPAEADGSSVPLGSFVYTAGTAASPAVAPATPARSLLLAYINVPASGGGASTITWVANYLPGGIVPIRSVAEWTALMAAYPPSTEAIAATLRKDATAGKWLELSADGAAKYIVDARLSTDPAPESVNAVYQYRPANAAALAALTGMRAWDIAIQVDTGVRYRYTGAAWARIPGDVIASGTFAAAATVTIDGLTGYSDYEIVLDVPTASVANDITMKLRAATVTLSANYDLEALLGTVTTASAYQAFAGTSVGLVGASRADKHATIRMSRLNEAVRTAGMLVSSAKDVGANAMASTITWWHTAATACDGVIFTASTGTITGTYIVRGLA